MCLKFYCMWTRKNEASLKFVVVKFGNGETVRFNRLDWMSSSSIKSRHHCHVLKNTLDYILNLVFFLCDCLFSFFFCLNKNEEKKKLYTMSNFSTSWARFKISNKRYTHKHSHLNTHSHTQPIFTHAKIER